ncbi:MAG: hypothetical protein GVY02_08980 [Bacteroidetes bacterium]|jgi:hypothetical protein|nr:hypothetical protein [Bacteroidota bacterium]
MASSLISFVSVKAAGERSGAFRKSRNSELPAYTEGKAALEKQRPQFILDKAGAPVDNGLSTPHKKSHLNLEKHKRDSKKISKDEIGGMYQPKARLMGIEDQRVAHVGNLEEHAWRNIDNIKCSEINSVNLGSQHCTQEIYYDQANWKKAEEAKQSAHISMAELQYHKEMELPSAEYGGNKLRSAYEFELKRRSEQIDISIERGVVNSNAIVREYTTVPAEKPSQVQNSEYDNIALPDMLSKSSQHDELYPGGFIGFLPLLLATPHNEDPRAEEKKSKSPEVDRQRVAFSALGERDHQVDLFNHRWVTKHNTDAGKAADQKLSTNTINASSLKSMTEYHKIREPDIQMSGSPDMKGLAAEQLKIQHYKQESIVSTPQTRFFYQSEIGKGHIVESLQTRQILGVHVHGNAEISEIQILSEDFNMTELLAKNQSDLKLSLRKIGVENFSLSFSTDQGLSDNKSRSSMGEDDKDFFAPEPIDTLEIEYSATLVDGLDILV